jgi:hypothetical protein
MFSNGGTVTRNIYFNCSSVISNGGVDETVGYEFSSPDISVTAGNGTATHMISIRPNTTFNSITNRTKFAEIELDFWLQVIAVYFGDCASANRFPLLRLIQTLTQLIQLMNTERVELERFTYHCN